MTTININEDSNNPAKYLIVTRSDASSETMVTTTVAVTTFSSSIDVVEISKIKGDKGDKGEVGPQGPAGNDGVIFDILPINSGGTNNSSFNTNKIVYYDGSKLTSSSIDVDNVATDVISNIFAGSGLLRDQSGDTVTVNANLGNGLRLDAYNQISIDDNIITAANFSLSSGYLQGKLGIPYGGTNNTFFGSNKLIYYDGEKIASLPLETGHIVFSGMTIDIVAGSGLIGGGNVSLPNGSLVLSLQDSSDIVVYNDTIELSTIVAGGTYSKVTVDDKGRVTNGSQLTLEDMTNILGFEPWHPGNDGAGSNLDADLLDGEEGRYYRNAANITGTLVEAELPDIITPATATKVEFNAKGLIVDSDVLNYLDITNGLGYIPFNKNGGQILDDVEILGTLLAESGSFDSYTIDIGPNNATSIVRGIKFHYGDFPQKSAILGYYPLENVFRIIGEGSQSGKIITEERADTKYIGVTGEQQISGIKTFMNNVNFYGRVIMRSRYEGLPAFDVGQNNLLVTNLNADFLDDKHGSYYRNATNLTGILNEYVIIPHIEDRATVIYNDFSTTSSDDGSIGGLEYIPRFHKPSSGHPMVLRDSIVYQTGYGVYVEDGSLSVGYLNNIDPDTYYSAFIGYKNSGSDVSSNSLAVGKENKLLSENSLALNQYSKAMSNNSIALGTHGETWIDDQISIGGFEDLKLGNNGLSFRNAHGQCSYTPLKFHGESAGWSTIRSFTIPKDKTLEYRAELLFTKQQQTGVAAFTIETGIVKNYSYRDPERSYDAFRKAVPVVEHSTSTLYNNSQERIYNLSIEAEYSEDIFDTKTTTFEVSAPPHQYENINIEATKNPIVIEPISDHSTKLYTIKGYTGYNPFADWYNPYSSAYRTGHLIKISPFPEYPYNTGAPIGLGENINNITECIYFRASGEKEAYIKFYNHGIDSSCPLDDIVEHGSNGISNKIRKDSNFNFYIPQNIETETLHRSVVRINRIDTSGFRTYVNKNVIGGISGYGSFDVYQTTGLNLADQYAPTLSNVDYNDLQWVSNKYGTFEFDFKADNFPAPEKNYEDIGKRLYNLTINKIGDLWNTLSLNISGTFIPELGCVDFLLSKRSPLSGPNVDFKPTSYYINDLSFSGNFYPYSYIKCIDDTFKYVDKNTLSFTENQLCFVDGNKVRLLNYPHQMHQRYNSPYSISNQRLLLQEKDSVNINNISTFITSIDYPIGNTSETIYNIDHDFEATGIYDIYLTNQISGIGFSDYRSFVTFTGTYTFSDNENYFFTKNLGDYSQTFPLVPKDETYSLENPVTVPSGSGFTIILPGPLDDTSTTFSEYASNILSNYNYTAVSSVIVETASNSFDIPTIQLIKQFEYPGSYNPGVIVSGIDANLLDIRINNLRIFDSVIPILYAGSDTQITNRHYVSMSSNTATVHVSGGLQVGDVLSYKNMTTNNNNEEIIFENSLRVDPVIPAFGNDNIKLTRFSNWLSSNMLWGGTITNTGTPLDFRFTPNNIKIVNSSSFVSNSGLYTSGLIATGSLVFELEEPEEWADRNFYFAESTCEIYAVENSGYTNFGKILNSEDISDVANLENNLVGTKIYEVLNITIASPSNTGIYSISVHGKKPYQTLNVSVGEHDELIRFLRDGDTDRLNNNLNISYNIPNKISGIFNIDNRTNSFLISDENHSKIYNLGYNNDSFSVAFESGILSPLLIGDDETGDIVLTHSKVYDLFPKGLLATRNNKQQSIFSFLNNSYLQSGIYDIVDLDGHDIYVYDFARSFEALEARDTGVLHRNYAAYNVTDSKFSLWGRDFKGDIIPYPLRDRPVFFGDRNVSCGSGEVCIQISGVPTYYQPGDEFFIDIDIGIYPQSTEAYYCRVYTIQGEPKLAAKTPQNSGLTIGMGLVGGYVSSTAYISGFENYSDVYGNDTAIVLANQTPFEVDDTYGSIASFARETETQTTSTIAIKNILENHFRGPYTVHNIIKPGVISVTNYIPKLYYDTKDFYYEDFYTTQPTRGVAIWRNNGSTGVAVMITGTENIQTDKDPNYNNRFMSISNNFSIWETEENKPLLFETKGFPTGDLSYQDQTNLSDHYGFNIVLNKYLSDCTFSGIYKPYIGSGLISSSAYLANSADWTISPADSTTAQTNLIIRDIDHFQLVSEERIIGDSHIVLSEFTDDLADSLTLDYVENSYYVENLPQDSGVVIRFGLVGGAGLGSVPPKVNVSMLDSDYTITKTYVSGINDTLLDPSYKFGPTSNSWIIDIDIDGLNNLDYFKVQFEDLLDGKIQTAVYNINHADPEPRIVNYTNEIYYDPATTIPWVLSFDLENVSENTAVGIHYENTADATVLNSGIFYTNGLNKWQGFILGNSPSSNSTYDFNFSITGEVTTLNYNTGIKLNDHNAVYTNRITNLESLIAKENIAGNITGYLNFQKAVLETTNVSPYFSNIGSLPTHTIVKLDTEYTAITNRELYRFVFTNEGPQTYNPQINFTSGGITYSDTTKIVVYENLFVDNIYLPTTLKFTDENWTMNFDIYGGDQSQVPNIQLWNTPTDYGFRSVFNNVSSAWEIRVTGNQNVLSQYGQTTGIYPIDIYVRDLTSSAFQNDVSTITYLCPLYIETVKKYYGVKDKSYFVNLDFNNCTDEFDSSYNLPTVNNFAPSPSQLSRIYDKYNKFINKNEVRYSGTPLLDKWGARIIIDNLNTERPYNAEPNEYLDPRLRVEAKGLDTDVISVIGFLEMKEIEVFSTDYPPLEIVNLEPDTEEEYNQGEDWKLEFDVVGGLADPAYPPTIVLSGLPSLDMENNPCSGYYPDIDIEGLPCMKSATFADEKWSFSFTGISHCLTGLFPLDIKAFDITGEDIENTAFRFKPLDDPGPSISIKELEFDLYPNCQLHSGTLQYSSSTRGAPCPYEMGVDTVELYQGSLPVGLNWFIDSNYPTVNDQGIGSGVISITGIPLEFPENNIYDPVIFKVTDLAGKSATVNVTYNTNSIVAMDTNPVGAVLYFPNSGTYEPISIDNNDNEINKVENGSQLVLYPYPGTGLFNCRSTLIENECPVQITGLYTKVSNSGLRIDFGSEQTDIQKSHVFAVFRYEIDGFENSNNNIYQLVNIGFESNYDPTIGSVKTNYTGVLTNHENLNIFSSISPTQGLIRMVSFEVTSKNIVDDLILSATPEPLISNDTCVLGDGKLIAEEGNNNNNYILSGKFRPSLIASIVGGEYPEPSTNPEYGADLQPINLLPGTHITTLDGFAEPETHEFFFSNCYESGTTYLSGVILPQPNLYITDPVLLSYNNQLLSFANRCSFGSNQSEIDNTTNHRNVDYKYFIRILETDEYIKIEDDKSSLDAEYNELAGDTDDNPIGFSAKTPIVNGAASGCIYHLKMWRESDKFPTFNPKSYDRMEHNRYWIHDSRTYDGSPSTSKDQYSFPAIRPVYFGSGITIVNNMPFYISGNIIGGDIDNTNDPSISNLFGDLSDRDTELLNPNDSNNPYDISLYIDTNYTNPIADGFWAARITGIIDVDHTIEYSLRVTIQEDANAQFGKTSITYIPVNVLDPISLDIPSTTININYGNKWELNFYVLGGDAPPSYYEDKTEWANNNTPIIEVNGQICNYDIITETYDYDNRKWTYKIRSRNIVTATENFTLSVFDSTGSDSASITVNVGS